MYKLNQIKLNIYHNEDDLRKKIAKLLSVSVDDIDWSTLIILHRAIDARDKKNILFVYNVAFDFAERSVGVGASLASSRVKSKLEKYEALSFDPIVDHRVRAPQAFAPTENSVAPMKKSVAPMKKSVAPTSTSEENNNAIVRPVVVGFGPAGIFASYILALNGLKPIIVERGKSLEERAKDVEKFFETLELDENSNVCFGEGGAGAFSDGKLNTNNKDKTGIYKFVLETFVKFGADEKILYENLPHIGTDKLVDVIKNMRNEILRLGGEIYYNTKMTYEGGLLKFASTNAGIASMNAGVASMIVKDTPVILAIGNSSRDTFRELIDNGFDIKAKAIAVGYRIAHRQKFIDEAQYGDAQCSDVKLLGPATYKLTYDVGNGHSVYSFCMCPGGYIINSSNYKGMLAINGMSYNDRSGKYANSAIVETVRPEDIEVDKGFSNAKDSQCSPLLMIEFQEQVEKAAFELEKGFIPYIASEGRDICSEDVFKGQARYCEKLKTVYEDCGLKININKDIEMALMHFNKIIPGFYSVFNENVSKESVSNLCQDYEKNNESSPIYLIAGVETRTSSPVKLDRDENYMCNVPNFYPCGEGLGHGGGIMSCAVDGINVAMSIAKRLINKG